MSEIIEKIKQYFDEENLFSFFIILIFIQYISLYFEKISAIVIFQPVIVTAIYSYINTVKFIVLALCAIFHCL